MAKKVKTEYKLPNPLEYRLSNPNYTIYHRAALGGLAATIRAWGRSQPEGITAKVERDHVSLSWDENLTDQELLRRLIDASFKLDEETKMIDLPGQRIGAGREDLRLAIHNGITATFLQHNKMRPTAEKTARRFELKTADDDTGSIFTYKAIDSYAHQKAQKTGLLEEKLKGSLPPVASLQQWTIPGATGGAADLQAPTEEVILLMYLMVGSAIFLLRSRAFQEKAQSCLIIPDVIDLVAFAKAIERIATSGQEFHRFSNTYRDRVVGGAEEAALRFLLDLKADEVTSEKSVTGCIVVAMGKVSWDKNQINRSLIAKVKSDYAEMAVFKAAYQYLGRNIIRKNDDGIGYIKITSHIPELVAANLAAGRHWCAQFKDLVSEKKDFNQMLYAKGGLRAMKDAIKDADDKAIIRAFQEAWRFKMGALGERARSEGLDFGRLVEVERERTRNDILRTKTADMLASWFLRFCADATKGRSLATMREDGERIRKFMFNQRNFERFQNLCLFALVSYAGDEAKSATGGTV
jgi:CRISPR-associated protein Cas8a1/Csx13